MLSKLNQCGDTIVEVLVAISIISLVLAAGYAVTGSSLTATRQSQEREIVLGILQSQLEQVKSLSSVPATQPFCMLNDTVTHSTDMPGNTGCSFNNSGNNGNTAAPVYNVSVSNSSNVYTATANWVQTGGRRGQDTLTLVYKLYQ